MQRYILLFVLYFFFVGAKEATIHKIFLVGDSTMQDYSIRSNYLTKYYPVTGWGETLQKFLCNDSLPKIRNIIDADSVIIVNKAMGGRSTRKFFEEGRWQQVYNMLGKSDYVFIQFGHNDASKDHHDRYVDTTGYKNYLRLFIKQSREKGAIPILVTPANRNYPWEDGQLSNVHGNYPDAVKEVAKETDVLLVDMTQRSIDFFTQKGKKYVSEHYFMNLPAGKYQAYPEGNNDNTHFQPEGAYELSRVMFEGLKELHNSIEKN